MKITSMLNAKHFGELAKIHGIVTYKISPFEQRAFANAISHGIPNIFRRISSNIVYVVPPFVIGYVIYSAAEARHTQYLRKNPADFADDE